MNEGDDRSLIDRYHALKDLAHDFNHAARTYATIIIEGTVYRVMLVSDICTHPPSVNRGIPAPQQEDHSSN